MTTTPQTLHQRHEADVILNPPPTGPTIDELIAKRMLASPSLYLQQVGRIPRGRLVHAPRARKLRRRGETVRFAGFNEVGRATYRWTRNPIVIDFAPVPDLVGLAGGRRFAFDIAATTKETA